MLNVEKPAPSIVAIAALLRNCATTEPSPALLVGIVLMTTCFRGASTWAFVDEISFLTVNSKRGISTTVFWYYTTWTMLAHMPRQGKAGAIGRQVRDQPQTGNDDKNRKNQL